MKVFMVAGEASGDLLGKHLIEALKEERPGDISFYGVGGDLMAESGMDLMLNYKDFSVMGLWEVLGSLGRLREIFKQVIDRIEQINPDVVVTIDFPDFNFFLGKALRKRMPNIKIVHMGAPTVWAWRAGRAKKISKFLDGLMCLFPFEPRYFKPHGLRTKFIGHPIVEEDLDSASKQRFCELHEISEDALIMGVYYGSRAHEIERMSEVLNQTVDILSEHKDNLIVVIPTLPHLEFEVIKKTEDLSVPRIIVTRKDEKWDAMISCDIALAVSGTVGLELSYAGVPHVIAYKTSQISWWILRMLVKVKNAHLTNIIFGKSIVPEFIQKQCNPIDISEGLFEILDEPKLAGRQRRAGEILRDKLGHGEDKTPSQKAAEFVLKIARKSV